MAPRQSVGLRSGQPWIRPFPLTAIKPGDQLASFEMSDKVLLLASLPHHI